MARQKQSEPSLGLDRRQLLAATAAVTAAGIVPNAKAAGTTNSVQAATVTKAWVSETPALNVCASTARKIQEIAARNIIREEAGLPLLSVPKELRQSNHRNAAQKQPMCSSGGKSRAAAIEHFLRASAKQFAERKAISSRARPDHHQAGESSEHQPCSVSICHARCRKPTLRSSASHLCI